MPNWCMNSILFEDADGDNKNIRPFWNMIDRALKKGRELKKAGKTEAGDDWYGHILNEVGVSPDEHYCRGFVDDYEDLDDDAAGFTLWSSTAWEPMMEPIAAVVNRYNELNGTDIRFYYSSEEGGNDIYETNDVTGDVFGDGCIVDDLDSGGREYLERDANVHEWLNETYGTTFTNESIDDINTYFQDKGQAISVHKFEVNYDYVYKEV